MMRVLVAEDNPNELNFIKELLLQDKDVEIIGEANNGLEALNLFAKKKPDVAFLDISMPGLSGMELAKKINQKAIIVFITAHNEFAVDAFTLGSLDYVLKPIDPERFNITLRRLKKTIFQKKGGYSSKFTVNIKGSLMPIDISKIIYIEKVPLLKKIQIYLDNNQELRVYGSLEKYEQKLKEHGFVRCHKSYIINMIKVEKVFPWGNNTYLAKLLGLKKEILVSRHYAATVKLLMKNSF